MFVIKIFFLVVMMLAGSAFISPPATNDRLLKDLREKGKVVLHPRLHEAESYRDKSFHGNVIQTERDQLDSVVRIISSFDLMADLPSIGTMTDLNIIRHYVNRHQNSLGVTHNNLRLVQPATLKTEKLAFYKFDVYRRGLLVEDASLLFRFRNGRLVQVVNRTFSEATLVDDRDELTDRELLQLIEERIGANKYRVIGSSYRVVADDDRYRLLKVRNFQQELGEGATVQIDVNNGKIFELSPRRFYAGGTTGQHGFARARLYQRYYQQESVFTPLRELAINFIIDTDTRSRQKVITDHRGRFPVLPGATPHISRFFGAKVSVTNHTGPEVAVEGVLDDGKWHTVVGHHEGAEVHDDKLIAQSMVFHHTNKIIRLASNYIDTPWFRTPLSAHTNINNSCNAHWDGRFSTINFYSGGRGCANTGLIADIVYHEWGHGLDDKTGGIRDGAFSEGFGDIISMLVTKSPIIGVGFMLDGRPVRDLEPDRIYPRDSRGTVHEVGLIIGSTFWDLFKKFKEHYSEQQAIEFMRRYAFQMIFTAERYTDVYRSLLVIDDDDGNLINGTPNFCLINEIFSDHGLTKIDRRCLLVTFAGNELDELNGNNNQVIEPGELIELTPRLKNVSGRRLTEVRGQATSDSDQLHWQATTVYWPAINNGATVASEDPLTFSLNEDLACGSSFNIKLQVTVGKDQKNFTEKFTVGRLVGEPQPYQAVGLPIAIPDLTTVTAGLIVDDELWQADTEVHKAQLRFAVNHTFIGDLTASLISPNGEVINIEKFSGRGKGTIRFNKDVSDKLTGRIGRGKWKLQIADTRRADMGTIEDFVLILTPKNFVCDTRED